MRRWSTMNTSMKGTCHSGTRINPTARPWRRTCSRKPFNPLFVLFSMAPGPRAYNLFVSPAFLLAGLCTYLYLRLFLPLSLR